MTSQPWDVLRSEMYDTIQAQSKPELRPCIYCGGLTRSIFQVCCGHSDLPTLELENEAQG